MSEKSLEERIKELEDQSKGLEMATYLFVRAICDEGRISIEGVASAFKKMSEAMSDAYGFGGTATGLPFERISALLDAIASSVKKHQGEK